MPFTEQQPEDGMRCCGGGGKSLAEEPVLLFLLSACQAAIHEPLW